MKKIVVNFAIGILLGTTLLTICGENLGAIAPRHPDHYLPPVENLPGNDSSSRYGNFKELVLLELKNNDRLLLRLQEKMDGGTRLCKTKYAGLLTELHQQNKGLRTRVLAYSECPSHHCVNFERDLREEVYELEHTIRNFTISS